MKCNGPKRKQPQKKPKTGPQSRIHPPSAAPKGRGQKLPYKAPRYLVRPVTMAVELRNIGPVGLLTKFGQIR